jgi:predicted Co/Zn/Cd cation transporter (cation efflux family)
MARNVLDLEGNSLWFHHRKVWKWQAAVFLPGFCLLLVLAVLLAACLTVVFRGGEQVGHGIGAGVASIVAFWALHTYIYSRRWMKRAKSALRQRRQDLRHKQDLEYDRSQFPAPSSTQILSPRR